MEEHNGEKVTIGLHTAAGVGIGYLSTLFPKLLIVPAGIVLLLALGFLSERLVRKRGLKWWLGSGVIIYLLVWLVAWTFFLSW